MNVEVKAIYKSGWAERITESVVPALAQIPVLEFKPGCIVSACNTPAKKLKHGWFCEKHYWITRAKARGR
jgi:hypothetical protein